MMIFLIHFIYLFFIQEYAKGKRLPCISLKAQTNEQLFSSMFSKQPSYAIFCTNISYKYILILYIIELFDPQRYKIFFPRLSVDFGYKDVSFQFFHKNKLSKSIFCLVRCFISKHSHKIAPSYTLF